MNHFIKGMVIGLTFIAVVLIAVVVATGASQQDDPGIRVKVAPDGAVCHYYEESDGSIAGFDCDKRDR